MPVLLYIARDIDPSICWPRRLRTVHVHLGSGEIHLPSLHLRQIVIQPAPFHQFGVRAALDDASLIEHHDQIGITHGCQPVSDDEGCATVEDALEVVVDESDSISMAPVASSKTNTDGSW